MNQNQGEPNYTPDQLAFKQKIERGGVTAGVIACLIFGLIGWFLLSSSFPYLSFIFVPLIILASYKLVNYIYVSSSMSDAKCAKCKAEYSVVHENQEKKFLQAVPRRQETSEGNVWYNGSRKGKEQVQVSTWTDEKYEVFDTYRCCSCDNQHTVKSIQTVKTGQTSDTIYR